MVPNESLNEPKEITDPKELLNLYKKNGSFDKQRRKLIDDFKSSETHNNLLLKLKLMVENKVKNDPSLLMKNKGKIGALIQGEIINDHSNKDSNNLLGIVDRDIQEKIIDSPNFRTLIKNELKDLKRRQEGISDEQYNVILQQEAEQETTKLQELQQKTSEKEAYNSYRFDRNRVSKPPKFNITKPNHKDNSNGAVKDMLLKY